MKIDLLEPDQEEKYSLKPQLLFEELDGNPEKLNWVVIDEVQKCPKLLDVVHKLINSTYHRVISDTCIFMLHTEPDSSELD